MCVKRVRELIITESLASKKGGFMTMIGLVDKKKPGKDQADDSFTISSSKTRSDDCRRRDQILANNIE